MSLLDRIQACAEFTPDNFRPLVIDGRALGRVRHAFAETLLGHGDVFTAEPDGIGLVPGLSTPAARTEAVGEVLAHLHAKGLIPGWRGEHYPVSESFYAPPALTVERAAVPLLGTMGYGVHLNGYVIRDGVIYMWIGKRSMQKPTGPGKLDQVVAGGQPIGLSVFENLIKECREEAGMPPQVAARAKPAGTVSYLTEKSNGLRHDVLFNFDIVLPDDFEPVPMDGEVDAFYLWPMDRVMECVRETEDFKFNAALVIIDFAVRHGVIGPDDPDYIRVTEAIRLGARGAFAAR